MERRELEKQAAIRGPSNTSGRQKGKVFEEGERRGKKIA